VAASLAVGLGHAAAGGGRLLGMLQLTGMQVARRTVYTYLSSAAQLSGVAAGRAVADAATVRRVRVAASLAVGLGHSAAGAGRQGGGRFYSMLKLTGMPVPVKVTVVRNLGFAKKQSR